MLAKFAIKQQAVHVILELCNDDNTIHDTLLNFVKYSVIQHKQQPQQQIFERLQANDCFSLITLRSGQSPFVALFLEKKSLNLKMKYKQLCDLGFTSRMHMKPSKSLSEVLISCFNETYEAFSKQPQIRVNRQLFDQTAKWVVALVGPQQQNLRGINMYLNRIQEKGLSAPANLVSIQQGYQLIYLLQIYRQQLA
ncbi:hypothetical protein FGO68_gene11014 [Halteria grandinella]|uniref:Uncharacterized protein n=1 Tax=Halteria grandinella TaxID=5974 RepID=A0A8J8P2G6_HALGN|nr:hypothetical protein FGO68_gene11014 [Halteria grandinella]